MPKVSAPRGSRVSQPREPAFNAQVFLDAALVAKSVMSYARGEAVARGAHEVGQFVVSAKNDHRRL